MQCSAAFLCIVGVVCLIAFVGCKVLGCQTLANYIIGISGISFMMVIVSQLYYMHFRDYFGKKDIDS